MRRVRFLALVAVAVGFVALRADEPPDKHMEFVSKLRAKGYGDLALKYLEKLSKNPPAELKDLLPLEIAKTRIAAVRDLAPAQRLNQYAEARGELEKALKDGKGTQAARIRLEIARIARYQGQALLSKAVREEDEKSQEDLARKAEQQFIQAGKELDAAIKGIQDMLKAKASDSEKEALLRKQLAEDLAQARMERGLTYLEQAGTYLDTSKSGAREQRAQVAEAGRKYLEALVKDESVSPEASYLAYAWLIKAAYDLDDPTAAHTYFDRVMNSKEKAAQPAKRLARLLRIQYLRQDPTITDKKPFARVAQIEKEGEDWLKVYPGFKNSPEGQAIRYELGRAYLEHALGINANLKGAVAPGLARKASKLLRSLADADTDYSRKARLLDVQISLKRMGENKAISKLKDFDECVLKAQYETAMMEQTARKIRNQPESADKLEAVRRKHLDNVIAAYERGLQLADAQASRSQLDEARYYLTVGYLLTGKPDKAAEIGEKLAKERESSKWSAPAAAYALDAYSRLIDRDKEGTNDAARQHLRDLAAFVVNDKAKVWQGEPVMPLARYELARLAIRDRDHVRAVEHLEKLPPDFAGYTFAQCQAAFEALNAGKDAKTDAERLAWKQRALAALRRVPRLPDKTDMATAQMFFAAQLEQGKMSFEDGSALARKGDLKGAAQKYTEMVQFAEQLEQQFKKDGSIIAKGPREKLQQALGTLKKYGLLGAADLAYRAGDYDRVLSKDQAGGVLLQVQALGKGGGKVVTPDFQLTGNILGLALRAQVQKGNLAAAQETLNLIQRLTGTGDEAVDPATPLRSLLGELQAQVRDLQAKGDKEKLAKTKGAFSSFIGTLQQQLEKKGLTRSDIIFLATSYSSLEEYDKAAALYGKVQPPRLETPKEQKEDPEQAKLKYEQDRQAYWFMRIYYAKALRMNKQFAEARKVLDEVMAAPDAGGKILAQQERNYLLEDQGKYAAAINSWGEFMKSPTLKRQLGQDPKAKDLYFDAYYHHAYCWYKYSQGVQDARKAKTALFKAAQYVVALENVKGHDGWSRVGSRFRELLRQEPALHQAYEELKKKVG